MKANFIDDAPRRSLARSLDSGDAAASGIAPIRLDA